MRKSLYMIAAVAVLLVSCSKEKEITIDHPVSAEFGQDMPAPSVMSVLYLDTRGKANTGDEIKAAAVAAQPELFLVAGDGTIDGMAAAEWIAGNCEAWGHEVTYAADGCMGSSSREDIYFEAMEALPSGRRNLLAETGGYAFVIGDVTEDDSRRLADMIVHGTLKRSWIIILPQRCGILSDYTFTDCLVAQSGQHEEEGAVRDLFIYASQGVWSNMSAITTNPVSFTVNIGQE